MIKVIVKTSTERKEKSANITDTPFSCLPKDIETNSHINLNGTTLTLKELNETFEALGVQDGSTVNLNSVVKADGANN